MITKSPFNYIGNKYRILPDIQRYFPKEINKMVDLFCGGCDVIINTDAKVKYANDINYHLIDILKEFQNCDTQKLIKKIEKTIKLHGLSKTDEEAYIKFRNHYNKTRKPIDLFVLMCFSFNYQFRFNADHEYNNPFGKNRSSFNETTKNNLIAMKPLIDDINFSSQDFRTFNYSKLRKGDFVYADPPYTITCGSYNDGKRGFKGWTENDDKELFEILDRLSKRGIKFALSNVSEHKGRKNRNLMKWKNKNHYHLHTINLNYDNCNYQTKNKQYCTKEVLITNY